MSVEINTFATCTSAERAFVGSTIPPLISARTAMAAVRTLCLVWGLHWVVIVCVCLGLQFAYIRGILQFQFFYILGIFVAADLSLAVNERFLN